MLHFMVTITFHYFKLATQQNNALVLCIPLHLDPPKGGNLITKACRSIQAYVKL